MVGAYNKLKKLVLPTMTNYQDDILVHDKNQLKGFKGSFIHGSRVTGTDIVRFKLEDYKYNLSEVKFAEMLKDSNLFLLRKENKSFYYFDGEHLELITKTKAESLLKLFYKEVERRYEFTRMLKMDDIAYELYSMMTNYGKFKWKRKMKDDFDSCCGNSEIRRVRNYFDYDKIKFAESLEDLTKALYENILFSDEDVKIAA